MPMDQVPEAYLVPLEGETAGKQIPLAARMVIGRAHDCEIHVLDSTISRQHAEVCLDRGKFVVCDIDSRNSVLVNGKNVSEWELTTGDVIQLGGRTFRFEMGGAAQRPAAWKPEEKTKLAAADGLGEESGSTIRISAEESAALLAKLFGTTMSDVRGQASTPLGGSRGAVSAPAAQPAPAGQPGQAAPAPAPAAYPAAAPAGNLMSAKTEIVAAEAFQATPTAGASQKAYACLRAIHHISDAVFSVEGEEAILAKVLEQVLQAVNADRASLVRKNAERDEFAVRASFSKDGTRKDEALAPARGAIARVAGSSLSVTVTDGPDARLIMYAPVSTGAGVPEAIAVDRLVARRPFDGDDLEMLAAIARQASLSLEKLRMPATSPSPGAAASAAAKRAESQIADVTILTASFFGFRPREGVGEARTVVEVINQYLTLMEGVLLRHGAKIDHLGPDGLEAFWGAPAKGDDDALRAARCASELHTELVKMNTLCGGAGLHPVQVGVALHSGPAVAGTLGSNERAAYTVVGETANEAWRLRLRSRAGETLLTAPCLARLGTTARTLALPYVELPGLSGLIQVHLLQTVQ